MFGAKKRRRRRRSELRLGAEAINFETTTTRPALSLTPVLNFWWGKGAKICGLAVLCLLGWIFYLLFSNPSFYVYGATISGNSALSAQEIYAAGQIDSRSIFWTNPLEVEQRIEAMPNIKSARVSIGLPGQVAITVVERRPQLLWQVDDTIWWVDHEGTIVPPRSEAPEDMLRIIDDDRQPLEVGYQIDSTIIQGAQALRLLVPDVRIIRHTRAQGLIVATPEGWPVYLGDGSEMRAKLIVLSALLPEIRGNSITPSYIDLRNPLRPVYKALPVIRIGQPTFAPPQPVVPPVSRP